MFERLFNLADFISLHFRLNDIVDILLFAVVVYYLLKFMLARPQRLLLFLTVVTAVIFSLSKIFDLFLLVGFINYFAAILVALAVILQKDLRRFFEQFSAKIFFGTRKNLLVAQDIDTLVASISELAEKEIGAILVFSGKEHLDNIIHGGSSLNATINPNLMESIFDTRTPGHDGAMIVERGKIINFGCHLPLSKDQGQIQNLGTRHSAALGLAEKSDAFVVVVSEERGTISIAQNSHLDYNVSAVKLKVKLETFYNLTESGDKETVNFIDAFRSNLPTKIGAFIIALISWLVIAYQPGTSFKSVMLPIEFRNLDPELSVQKLSQDEIKVTLSGPSKIMNTLRLDNKKIALDFKDVNQGYASFPATKFQLELPREVTKLRFKPNRINAEIIKFSRILIPIKPKLQGQLPKGIDLIKINIDPAKKTILIPSDMSSKDLMLSTQAIQLDQISKSNTRIKTNIILPDRMRIPSEESAEVYVDFVIRPPVIEESQ